MYKFSWNMEFEDINSCALGFFFFFIRTLNFRGKPGSNIFTMKIFYQEISRNDPEFQGLDPPVRHFIDPGKNLCL